MSDLQNENEQLGKENGELKMALNDKVVTLQPESGQSTNSEQVQELQHKVSLHKM